MSSSRKNGPTTEGRNQHSKEGRHHGEEATLRPPTLPLLQALAYDAAKPEQKIARNLTREGERYGKSTNIADLNSVAFSESVYGQKNVGTSLFARRSMNKRKFKPTAFFQAVHEQNEKRAHRFFSHGL